MRHRVSLLNTRIDKVDLDDAVAQIDRFVRDGVPHQVVTVNVDFLRLGEEDPTFRDLINTSDLVVADGMPLVWGSRMLGDALPERVTGVDLLSACARLSAEKGYSIFLLGATPGVAEEAANVLRGKYPGVRIAATYAPPMGPFSEAEEEKMVRLVQEVQPDMLFVAFGAPKQDRWIRRHMHQLHVPVCMGVGGSFDFLAGRTHRAPSWMQDRGLEWLYRVIQEPRRLWKRYFVEDMPIFLRMMAQDRAVPTALLEGPAMRPGDVVDVVRGDGSSMHVA